MKELSAFLLTFLAGLSAAAQLSVKPSATGTEQFLYVRGDLLYVDREVNLQKNRTGSDTEASIYLRQEAQLVQGSAGASGNSGDGLLSIFQEGSSNAFDYNYWGAPVSDPVSGRFGIRLLHSPQTRTKSLPAEITEAHDGTALPLRISSFWIHSFTGREYSHWQHLGDRSDITPGLGFTMKGVKGTDPSLVEGRQNNPGSAQRYDFRGSPNNGSYEVPMVSGDYVLLGNPYPSALDLSRFLLENSGTGSFTSGCGDSFSRKDLTTGVAYFWDSRENGSSHQLRDYYGGYGVFSPVDPCTSGIYEKPVFAYFQGEPEAPLPPETGQHYERRYLPVGQGFMLESTSGAPLEFNNSHRVFRKEGDYSDFKRAERAAAEGLQVVPKLRLAVSINQRYTRHLSLGFWSGASRETDFGMDARTMELAPSDVGWLQNNESYTIDVRPFEASMEVPLYLQVEDSMAHFDFRLQELENLSPGRLFLYDSEEERYFPLGPKGTQLSLPEGTYHGRFRLSFGRKLPVSPIAGPGERTGPDKDLDSGKEASPGAEPVPESLKKRLKIVHHQRLRQLEVLNPEQLPLRRLVLYDMKAKEVRRWNPDPGGGPWRVSTRGLPASLYFLKLQQQDFSEITEKILILDIN